MNGDVGEIYKLNNDLQLTAHTTAVFFLVTECKDIASFIAHDKTTGAGNTRIHLQNHWAETFQKQASCTEPVFEASGFQWSTVRLEDPTSENIQMGQYEKKQSRTPTKRALPFLLSTDYKRPCLGGYFVFFEA